MQFQHICAPIERYIRAINLSPLSLEQYLHNVGRERGRERERERERERGVSCAGNGRVPDRERTWRVIYMYV